LNGWNALDKHWIHPAFVPLLFKEGANMNAVDACECYMPLTGAACAKNIESLRLMLQFGADPNMSYALAVSAGSGHEDAVRLLLEFGANPNSDCSGLTVLAHGAEYPAIVALLLGKGANPNAGGAGSYGNPLACAAHAKNIESLRLMFAHGGDAARVDHGGGNVLHISLQCTDAECCRELLVHGADPCGQGLYGDTPMHVVARNARRSTGPESLKILDLLLEAGASVLAVNGGGLTPGQVARQHHEAIMAVQVAREDQQTMKDVLEWFAQHEAV
jgi:ankyrin repeat protein